MTEVDDGLTTTVTTLVLLLPPQPARASRTRALTPRKNMEHKLRDFITTRTPKFLFSVANSAEKGFLHFAGRIPGTPLVPRATQNHQKVRLTVKRKVVFGSK